MHSDEILILNGTEVGDILAGCEHEIIDVIAKAYKAHGRGESSLPHSTFLRFPNNNQDRIIALPAYLSNEWEIAGLKWVSSFPDNVQRGLDRASALIILNSLETGRPEAILEGSIISAKRTAASAALAAQSLRINRNVSTVGLIGCGLINYETAGFLRSLFPEINGYFLYDLNPARANKFKQRFLNGYPNVDIEITDNIDNLLRNSSIISMATTATTPYIFNLSSVPSGAVVLHISLRDISPQIILTSDNVVDDIDHVCRAQTSVHLAEQLVRNRNFIRCTLADILNGNESNRTSSKDVTIFSPFGLGVLDLALSKLVVDLGLKHSKGIKMQSFFPESYSF